MLYPPGPLVIARSDNGVIINVRVVPRASRSGPAGVRDGALLLRLHAPPVEGAANAEVVDVLADLLGVARTSVTILSGHHNRRKRVEVAGITVDAAARAVAAAARDFAARGGSK